MSLARQSKHRISARSLQQAEEGRAEGLEGEGRGGREVPDECVHLRALREEETGGGRALAPRGGGDEVGIRHERCVSQCWITGDEGAQPFVRPPLTILQPNYGPLTRILRVKSSLGAGYPLLLVVRPLNGLFCRLFSGFCIISA